MAAFPKGGLHPTASLFYFAKDCAEHRVASTKQHRDANCFGKGALNLA